MNVSSEMGLSPTTDALALYAARDGRFSGFIAAANMKAAGKVSAIAGASDIDVAVFGARAHLLHVTLVPGVGQQLQKVEFTEDRYHWLLRVTRAVEIAGA